MCNLMVHFGRAHGGEQCPLPAGGGGSDCVLNHIEG